MDETSQHIGDGAPAPLRPMRAVEPREYREPPERLRWRWSDLVAYLACVTAGVALSLAVPDLPMWENVLVGVGVAGLWLLIRALWHRRPRRASSPVSRS